MLGNPRQGAAALVGDSQREAPSGARPSRTMLVSVDSPDCEIADHECVAEVECGVIEGGIEGAASETGMPVVISSRYRPKSAALSDVPRATSTMRRGPILFQRALESLHAASRQAPCASERFRLLPDFFQHSRHCSLTITWRQEERAIAARSGSRGTRADQGSAPPNACRVILGRSWFGRLPARRF